MSVHVPIKRTGKSKPVPRSIPTEYVDANGRRMISYCCDFCAIGMPIKTCASCNGTGVYSIPARSETVDAMTVK